MDRDTIEIPPPWEQLITWIAVVETGSVSLAAARLSVSQASVSQHIRQLEKFYGAELLDRRTRPGRPTASGQRLLEQSAQLLSLAADMSQGVRSFSRSKRPVVRIGCIDSFAATFGPQLVKGLSGNVHNVRLFSGLSPALTAQFNNRQIDLLITTGDLGGTAFVARQALLTEQYLVVVPADHEIRQAGSLSDLCAQLRFMHYSARSVLGAHINAYLSETDPGIERSFEFDATDPLLALVAAGLGFAITTPLCLWQSRHHAGSVRVLPLSAFTRGAKPYAALSRTLYLSTHEGELGGLPGEIRSIIQVAGRALKRELTKTLKLGDDALTIEAEG